MIDLKPARSLLMYGMPAYSAVSILYLILIFALPASPQTMEMYNLSSLNYHVLLFVVALPSLFVWFGAFLSQALLKSYAQTIHRAKEGPYFNNLADGTAWLAFSLPVIAITILILNAICFKSPGFRSTAIIISIYVSILLPLIGFTIIGKGARGLFMQAKLDYKAIDSRGITLFFIALGVLYCFLTFRKFDLTSLGSSHNPYFLPVWFTVLTIIIPSLYSWFVGILASWEINLFSREVKGVFYRQSLRLLVAGLSMVILSLIALQYINSVQPRTQYLVLDFRLALNLVFRVLLGMGFGTMALGALRLKKIEEI